MLALLEKASFYISLSTPNWLPKNGPRAWNPAFLRQSPHRLCWASCLHGNIFPCLTLNVYSFIVLNHLCYMTLVNPTGVFVPCREGTESFILQYKKSIWRQWPWLAAGRGLWPWWTKMYYKSYSLTLLCTNRASFHIVLKCIIVFGDSNTSLVWTGSCTSGDGQQVPPAQNPHIWFFSYSLHEPHSLIRSRI